MLTITPSIHACGFADGKIYSSFRMKNDRDENLPGVMKKTVALTPIEKPRTVIVYGVFKAMGDLLCASPVFAHELRGGAEVHLLIFASGLLVEFLNLIDFGPDRSRLYVHFLPVTNGLSNWRHFVAQMKSIQPDRVWISPHAPKEASSWKIPFVLRVIRLLSWKNVPLSGADSERGAFALDNQVALDRSLPFVQREWQGYRMAFGGLPEKVEPVQFIPELRIHRTKPAEFDVLIHPGANAKNRSWPAENFGQVVRMLPSSLRVAIVGVESDIASMREVMPSDRALQYRTGTLSEAIAAIASARVLLTMDSGNVHFAQVLGVPAVALFGKSDPVNIISLGGTVDAVYQKKFPCQPCGKATCSQPEVYCMNALSPDLISQRIMKSLGL